MKKRVILHPAFILHTRPFRDASLLIDILTMRHGKISLIAHGAKLTKSKFRGFLRPFAPLVISWSGKTALYTLTQAEATAPAIQLKGRALLSAMYVNELLIKLLAHDDPHPEVFFAYQTVIHDLESTDFEAKLRYFEMELLHALGYGLDLKKDVFNRDILPEQLYYFDPECGILPYQIQFGKKITFKGESLLALANKKLQIKEDMQAAKQLMRLTIGVHLRTELKTREVFAAL